MKNYDRNFQKNSGNKIPLIVAVASIIVLLLASIAVCAYMYLQTNQCRKSLYQMREQYQGIQNEKQEIEGKYEEVSAQLDELTAQYKQQQSEAVYYKKKYDDVNQTLPVDQIASETQATVGTEASTVQLEASTAPETATSEESNNGVVDMNTLQVGQTVTESQIDFSNLSQYFQAYEIDDTIFSRISGKSFKDNCTVPREDLRYLKVIHYNFDGQIQVGEVMVNRLLSDDFVQIFQELFEAKYEIYGMRLVDDYGADDCASIDADNTSAFNFRTATNSDNLSNHAAGCAIDINPRENPYISGGSWVHDNASNYIERENQYDDKHMIDHNDACYKIFIAHGFSWGGDWQDPVDYQHFEKAVYW